MYKAKNMNGRRNIFTLWCGISLTWHVTHAYQIIIPSPFISRNYHTLFHIILIGRPFIISGPRFSIIYLINTLVTITVIRLIFVRYDVIIQHILLNHGY